VRDVLSLPPPVGETSGDTGGVARQRGQRPGGPGGSRFVRDPLSGSVAELRRVQPFQANKDYVCPGCNQQIARGLGHVVVVPLGDPDARRHWHNGCWERRSGRPGR
jgi:hypothetical protein